MFVKVWFRTPSRGSKRQNLSLTEKNLDVQELWEPGSSWEPQGRRSKAILKGPWGKWRLRLVWVERAWEKSSRSTYKWRPTICQEGNSSVRPQRTRGSSGPSNSWFGFSLGRTSVSSRLMRSFFWSSGIEQIKRWNFDKWHSAYDITFKTVFKRQKPASVVWVGLTSCVKKTLLIFIPKRVKVNQNAYLDMLKQEVLPWINRNTWPKSYCFQQDGAPSHIANKIWRWCFETFDEFWTKDMCPPSSLDLNAM